MKRLFPLLIIFVILSAISGCHSKPDQPHLAYTLEVSQADLLLRLSDYSRDERFNLAVTIAKGLSMNGSKEDFLSAFQRVYKQLAPDGKLANIFAPLKSFQGQISAGSSNEDVIAVIRGKMDEATQQAARVIEKRFAKYEDVTIKAAPLKGTSRIKVDIKGMQDMQRLLLVTSGRLEFWDTYENMEVFAYLAEADKVLAKLIGPSLLRQSQSMATATGKSNGKGEKDFFEGAIVKGDSTAGNTSPDAGEQPEAQTGSQSVDSSMLKNPLFSILYPMADNNGVLQEGAIVGMAFGKDTATVNQYLSIAEVRAILPRNLKLLWEARPAGTRDVYQLYAIKAPLASAGAPLTGDQIEEVKANDEEPKNKVWWSLIRKLALRKYAENNPGVRIKFNPMGAQKWETLTEAASSQNPQRCIAIVLDGRVLTAPRVMGKISSGNTDLSGLSSIAEAAALADVIRSGALPAAVTIVEENIVTGP